MYTKINIKTHLSNFRVWKIKDKINILFNTKI